MAINLNEKEYSSKEVIIFNEGKAGVVCGVKMSIEKKSEEAGSNFPDYKVIFSDNNGGSVDRGFYYPDPSKPVGIVLGKAIKHIFHTCWGEKKDLPIFEDGKDMIDKAMNLLRNTIKLGLPVNVVVDYGSGEDAEYQKGFLQVKTFPGFFEIDVPANQTKLRMDRNAFLVRKEPDSDITFGASGTADNSDDSSNTPVW